MIGPNNIPPIAVVMMTLKRLTWALERISFPEICLRPGAAKGTIICVSSSKYVACKVAPRSESIAEPSTPLMTPNKVSVLKSTINPERKSIHANDKPMIPPPMALTINPTIVTAPFVPGGTLLPDVINFGLSFDRIPNSEESVSARHVA